MRGRQSCIAAGRGRRRIPPAGRVLLPETPPGFLPMSASQPLVQPPLSAPASPLVFAVALAVLYVVWGPTYLGIRFEIGRASCRERGVPYVEISGFADSLK